MKKLYSAIPVLLAMAVASPVLASGGGSKESEDPDGIAYVELAPAFVTNFQAPKIRFLKADVSLKVKGSATAEAIKYHLPFIRNNLVMLFSRQSEESLNSPEGRQHLKEEALQEVISVLQTESAAAEVQEVLFTSFIVD